MPDPSYEQIAASFNLWREYADTSAAMSITDFEAMPPAARVAVLVETFGPEPEPVPTVTVRVNGLRWPETLGDWELMGPPNSLGSWRWYRRNFFDAINGLSVAGRIKVDNQLQPIWNSLVAINA